MCAASPRHVESSRFLAHLKAFNPHTCLKHVSNTDESLLKCCGANLYSPVDTSGITTWAVKGPESWTNVEFLASTQAQKGDSGKTQVLWGCVRNECKIQQHLSVNVFLLCDNFWTLQPNSTKNSGNTIAIIGLNSIDFDRNWNESRENKRK